MAGVARLRSRYSGGRDKRDDDVTAVEVDEEPDVVEVAVSRLDMSCVIVVIADDTAPPLLGCRTPAGRATTRLTWPADEAGCEVLGLESNRAFSSSLLVLLLLLDM